MTRASKWLVGEATSPSTEVAGEATGGAGDGEMEERWRASNLSRTNLEAEKPPRRGRSP